MTWQTFVWNILYDKNFQDCHANLLIWGNLFTISRAIWVSGGEFPCRFILWRDLVLVHMIAWVGRIGRLTADDTPKLSLWNRQSKKRLAGSPKTRSRGFDFWGSPKAIHSIKVPTAPKKIYPNHKCGDDPNMDMTTFSDPRLASSRNQLDPWLTSSLHTTSTQFGKIESVGAPVNWVVL